MNNYKKVIICGVAGNMGNLAAQTVESQENLVLAGGIDINKVGEKIIETPEAPLISSNLEEVINETNPDIMVDFTKGHVAPKNINTCLKYKIPCIVGTTGISDENLIEIEKISIKQLTPILMVPNFSIGAVLMMKFAKESAKFFEWGEIIELHHNKKADAPSGTSIRTAQMMKQSREKFHSPQGENENILGVRGGKYEGIHIHSIRLPGLLAHQEVILGGTGETLKIRHDSLSRECFMPGVVMAIKKINTLSGLQIGLEKIMN